MAVLGISNSFFFGKLVAVSLLFFETKIGSVYGGQFQYIPYNGTRPNNTVARNVCKSYGTCELAVIDSQSEYDRMYAYFNKTLGANFTLPSAVWIGLYWVDVTGLGNYTHFWETSGTMKELIWSKWDGGEPNGMGYENCGRIHTNMYFRTIDCSGNYDILCEGTGSSSCISGYEEECKMFTKCWWTPARVGLTIGFTSLFVFFCLICVGWKCFCAPKTQVGYEHEEDEEEADSENNANQTGKHNVMKNYNIDHMPVEPSSKSGGINSVILNKRDNSWMSPEELSFSARYSYKQ